jgi:hypothetical protein
MAYAAVWNVYTYSTATRSTAVATRMEVTDSRALAFGGGTRNSTILTAIQINTLNGSMHVASDTTQTATDLCPPAAMSPTCHNVIVKADGTATGCYINNAAAITTFAVGTPATCRGVGVYFKYADGATAQSTEVTQAQVWVGTGAAVTGTNGPGGTIYVVELQRAGKSWSTPTSASKTTLNTSYPKANHFWPLGFALKATAVGFNNQLKAKVEVTFQ